MDLGLEDKVAVVTGGSSGIGLATARTFLEEGAGVAICARGRERLSAAAKTLEADFGERLFSSPCDVLSPEQVEGFVEKILERFGSADILVNNAGGGRVSTFADTTDEAWREEIDKKFFGIIHMTRRLLPALQRSPAPRVVNVNAVLSRQPEAHMVATSAARSGALNLSKSMAREFAPMGILVNSVILGLIESNQWRGRYEGGGQESGLSESAWLDRTAREKGVPLGRFGKPEEVAAAIAFLCSERAGYITGATLEISGGVGRFV